MYFVTIQWPNKKETKYQAPSSSNSKEKALMDIALLWPAEFRDGNWVVVRVDETE